MLKSIARVFELKETSISKGTLRRILFLMIISLPTWPLVVLDYYKILPENWMGDVAFGLMVLGAIAMICFICTRFVNRFYFPDKYLDEWEIKIKHKSMTFAFMCLIWVLAPVVIILSNTHNFGLNLKGMEVAIWTVGLLLSLLYIQTFHALWQVRPLDAE